MGRWVLLCKAFRGHQFFSCWCFLIFYGMVVLIVEAGWPPRLHFCFEQWDRIEVQDRELIFRKLTHVGHIISTSTPLAKRNKRKMETAALPHSIYHNTWSILMLISIQLITLIRNSFYSSLIDFVDFEV